MDGSGGSHERRISTIEGEMKSVATKDDLSKLETRLTQFVNDSIKSQTNELNPKFDKISDDLQALNTKQNKITGAADILKTALPMLVSIATLIVLIISLLASG